MPHSIEISDSAKERLERLMGPDDTSGTLISRLLDFYEKGAKQNLVVPALNMQSDALRFEGFEVPDLTHARLVRAAMDGKQIARPNWNKIRQLVIVRAVQDGADIQNWGVPGLAAGEKDIHGYIFAPEIGMSIQGQDATDAWRSTLDVAHRLGLSVEVICQWREKAGAAFPGKTAMLSSSQLPTS